MYSGTGMTLLRLPLVLLPDKLTCDNSDKKGIYIMEKAHSNIMSAASDSSSSPRCLMISSIGIGGSSWLVKFLLQKIGGKEGFTDFENAEKRVLQQNNV
jgi:hypothetical protein